MTIPDQVFQTLTSLITIIQENQEATLYRTEMVDALAALKKALFRMDSPDYACSGAQTPEQIDSLFLDLAERQFDAARSGLDPWRQC